MPNAVIPHQECPHCFAEVMFKQDGLCPACRKSKFDTQGVNPNFTMVTINNNHKFPSCCFLCGENTNVKKYLSWSYIADPFSHWLIRLFSHIPGSSHRVRHQVCIPVCAECLPQAKRVKPISTIAGLSCRMMVHRKFRQQFEALNGKETLEWECDIRIGKEPPKFGVIPAAFATMLRNKGSL